MGLDMEILRISKPHLDDTLVYDRETIEGIVLTEDELKEPMYRQLTPYAQPARVRNRYYDMEKIRKDFGLSDDTYISAANAQRIAVTDRKTGSTVGISNMDIDRKYTIVQVEKCYICASEEVRYWRKAYDIQDWFIDHIGEPVENTGFYILSEDLLSKFNRTFHEDKIDVEVPDEDSALFYWEWY